MECMSAGLIQGKIGINTTGRLSSLRLVDWDLEGRHDEIYEAELEVRTSRRRWL